jgi:hypothetical protein
MKEALTLVGAFFISSEIEKAIENERTRGRENENRENGW